MLVHITIPIVLGGLGLLRNLLLNRQNGFIYVVACLISGVIATLVFAYWSKWKQVFNEELLDFHKFSDNNSDDAQEVLLSTQEDKTNNCENVDESLSQSHSSHSYNSSYSEMSVENSGVSLEISDPDSVESESESTDSFINEFDKDSSNSDIPDKVVEEWLHTPDSSEFDMETEKNDAI